MSFNDIKGQDRAISFLKRSIASSRISHAYIFHGPGGVGRRMTALGFAKAVNCRDETSRPCGVCASCKKIDSLNHPDLFMPRPEKPQASVGIDQVRMLIKDIYLKPYEARKKFYIIDEADGLTEEASNAILKTLEEPPSDSVIILIVENLGRMLPTVVSRSQAVKFFPLSPDEVKGILVDRYKIDKVRAHLLAHLSAGRIGQALKYNDEDFFAKREKVIKSVAAGTFFDSDFDKLSKPELKAYLDILLTWYRDMLIMKTALTKPPEIINVDMEKEISTLSAKTDMAFLDHMIRQILLTYSYAEQNANPKLAMASLGTAV